MFRAGAGEECLPVVHFSKHCFEPLVVCFWHLRFLISRRVVLPRGNMFKVVAEAGAVARFEQYRVLRQVAGHPWCVRTWIEIGISIILVYL